MTEPRSALVLGARNLGGSIAGDLIEHGWRVASVARSAGSLERVQARSARCPWRPMRPIPTPSRRRCRQATAANGAPSLFVNAVSASRSTGGPWGGGPVADGGVEGIRQWCNAGRRAVRDLPAAGRPGPPRRRCGRRRSCRSRADRPAERCPARGAWAAGAAATRALVHAAAQELREEDIHVALLIVDATIESPKTADRAATMPARVADPRGRRRGGRSATWPRQERARHDARADGHARRRPLVAVDLSRRCSTRSGLLHPRDAVALLARQLDDELEADAARQGQDDRRAAAADSFACFVREALRPPKKPADDRQAGQLRIHRARCTVTRVPAGTATDV